MNQELTNLFDQFVEKLKAEIIKEVKLGLAEPTPVAEVPPVEPVESKPEPVEIEPKPLFIEPVNIDKSLFAPDRHRLVDLLNDVEWPEAAPQFLICEDSESDKMDRAEGILDYIGDNLEGKKVLDFGCGEGHVALKASETASFAVGYDIVQPTKTGNDKCLLTNDFGKVKEQGPFDLVILYDTLDHCKDPVEALKQVKLVSGPNTKIFVRCHSWMSRHGAHLYKQLNKAWVHLIFTEEELAKVGVKMDFVQKYYLPIKTQNDWFKESGFKVVSSDIIKSLVEPFFKKPELSAILSKNFDGHFPEWQMGQVFNDYVLGV